MQLILIAPGLPVMPVLHPVILHQDFTCFRKYMCWTLLHLQTVKEGSVRVQSEANLRHTKQTAFTVPIVKAIVTGILLQSKLHAPS